MEKKQEEGGEETLLMMPGFHHLFEIHGELFLQLLLRLPFKYLIRLRCVSKSLLDLTNNPDFISFYLVQSKANPPNFFKDFNFIDTVPLRFSLPTSIDVTNNNLWRFHIMIKGSNFINLGKLGLTPFRYPDHKYLVSSSSSSNGLICFAGLNSLEIYNILSGVNYLIESNMVDPLWNSLRYPVYVFGFDPKSNDYKIVCFHPDSKWKKVFSFRNNSWKRLVVTLCSAATIWCNAETGLTICINGVIYWPLHPEDLKEGIGFVSFHLHQQRFVQIEPPPLDGILPNTQFCSDLQLLPFRGCPCFAYMKRSRKVGKRTTTKSRKGGGAAEAIEETGHSSGDCGFRVELLILKNNGGGDDNGENNEYWIRESIVTPFCLPHEVQIVSLCDQIFLAWFEAKHLRLYNLHTKDFFKLPRSPPSVCHPKVSRSNTKHKPTYVENLRFDFPLI